MQWEGLGDLDSDLSSPRGLPVGLLDGQLFATVRPVVYKRVDEKLCSNYAHLNSAGRRNFEEFVDESENLRARPGLVSALEEG